MIYYMMFVAMSLFFSLSYRIESSFSQIVPSFCALSTSNARFFTCVDNKRSAIRLGIAINRLRSLSFLKIFDTKKPVEFIHSMGFSYIYGKYFNVLDFTETYVLHPLMLDIQLVLTNNHQIPRSCTLL